MYVFESDSGLCLSTKKARVLEEKETEALPNKKSDNKKRMRLLLVVMCLTTCALGRNESALERQQKLCDGDRGCECFMMSKK